MFVFFVFFVETLNKDSGVKILGKTEKELTKVYWSTNSRTAERKNTVGYSHSLCWVGLKSAIGIYDAISYRSER